MSPPFLLANVKICPAPAHQNRFNLHNREYNVNSFIENVNQVIIEHTISSEFSANNFGFIRKAERFQSVTRRGKMDASFFIKES